MGFWINGLPLEDLSASEAGHYKAPCDHPIARQIVGMRGKTQYKSGVRRGESVEMHPSLHHTKRYRELHARKGG